MKDFSLVEEVILQLKFHRDNKIQNKLFILKYCVCVAMSKCETRSHVIAFYHRTVKTFEKVLPSSVCLLTMFSESVLFERYWMVQGVLKKNRDLSLKLFPLWVFFLLYHF